ncbi:GTP-binding protein [Trichinella nelsoni]|uniref:GTP-binding protein n=1 Tax=Trichinella nelsoni TaxID=6336 RepID=A0A0V0RUU7_9BILA|nr:GTP-binding protein [Trichinella nelsoni]
MENRVALTQAEMKTACDTEQGKPKGHPGLKDFSGSKSVSMSFRSLAPPAPGSKIKKKYLSERWSRNPMKTENIVGSCPTSPYLKNQYRLVVLGSRSTGKSCIVNRFLNGSFQECYIPTIENFHRKLYRIHGQFYQLDILDTSGNAPFPATRRLSILTGDLFLLVFSVNNTDSYEEVLQLCEQIRTIRATLDDSRKGGGLRLSLIIAANKIDLLDQPRSSNSEMVDMEAAERLFSSTSDCVLIRCSAKTGQNIDQLFKQLFTAGKLPKEMCQTVSMNGILTDGKAASPSMKRAERIVPQELKRRETLLRLCAKKTEPAVVEYDLQAKRPSLRTDLLMFRSKLMPKRRSTTDHSLLTSGKSWIGNSSSNCRIS